MNQAPPEITWTRSAGWTGVPLIIVVAVLAASGLALGTEAPAVEVNAGVAEAAALYDLWAGEQLAYNGVPGVVVGVVTRDGLAWAKGYGTTDLAGGVPLTPTTRFRIGSVSKVFTATAILQLRDAGKLRLDDPVVKHLPWFRVPSPFPSAPPITVEHLLTHTSGLSREAPFDAWTTHAFPTREELRAAMPRVTVISPPGKTYRYSNLGVALLGEIVATVSGESWAGYVRAHITAPLGMTSTTGAPTAAEIAALPRQHRRKQADGSRGTLDYYETGAIAPAAAIVSTLEDLARFAAFQLTADPAGPAAGGVRVLSGPTLAEMHRPHFVNPKWTGGRGLGWGVSRRDGHTYVSHGGWIGGHRADVILDPERGLAAIALTNADDASPGFFARLALSVVGGAVATSGTGPSAAPAPPDPGWKRYVGTYTDPWDWEIEVLVLDGSLVLYEHSYPPEDDAEGGISRLTPDGEHTFKLPDGETLRFELDAAGKVTRMYRRSDYYLPKGAARQDRGTPKPQAAALVAMMPSGGCLMRARVPRLFVLSAAVVAAFVALSASGAETPPGWDLPAADVQRILAKAGGTDAYPGAAVVTVFDRREAVVEESGMARTVQHTLVKALTADGARQLAVAELSYDPMSAAVEVLRCRVLAAAGGVRDADVAGVQDHPDTQGTILWNARHRLVPVGRLDVGDAVELVTRRVGFTYALLDGEERSAEARFVPPMKGHFYDIVPFFAPNPVVEQRYRVTIPSAKNLQYQLFNGGAEVEDRTAGGMRTVTVTLRGWRPAEPEKNMVDWPDVAPKLLLTTSPDWQAKAVWFHGVQEDAKAFAVTPELRKVADEVTAGLERADDKVAALTHWVAENIRYIGLHMGEGEGYTLHPAAMTLRDRGGVCKDKAGILTALLRAAGFEAYAGMTMAGERIEKIAADQFNHCITVWRRPDGATQLLDPTWVPGARELWSSREQQQEVLMGLPEGADIITTPISPASDHPLHLSVRSTLRADGTLEGTLRLTADGQSDSGLRRPYRGRTRTQWAAIDEGLLSAVDPRAVVRVTSRTDPDDLRVPFTIEAEFTIPGYARVLDDGSLLLTPLAARHPVGVAARAEEITLPLKPKERKYPVRIGCSKVVRLDERITLPAGAKVEGLPDDAKLDGAGSLQSTWKHAGSELVVSETLTLDRRIFAPEEWPALRAALESFRKLAETPLLVRPAAKGKGKA